MKKISRMVQAIATSTLVGCGRFVFLPPDDPGLECGRFVFLPPDAPNRDAKTN